MNTPMESTNLQDDNPLTEPGGDGASLKELQYHFEGLRSLFLFAIVALIAMTLTIDLCFIRRQMVFTHKQLEDLRPKINEKVTTYKKRTEPLLQNFATSMQSFATSNQDFQPIMDKYKPFLWSVLQQPQPPAPSATNPAKAPAGK